MAYTADIGAKGATVKEFKKAIELLDEKIGEGGGGGVVVKSYTITGNVSVSGDITQVDCWTLILEDGTIVNKNVALCNGGEELVFELGDGTSVTKSVITVTETAAE